MMIPVMAIVGYCLFIVLIWNLEDFIIHSRGVEDIED